jgi:hypothetical protein
MKLMFQLFPTQMLDLLSAAQISPVLAMMVMLPLKYQEPVYPLRRALPAPLVI